MAALPAEKLHTAIWTAFAAIERVQALMSYHDPASELSRINRQAASSEQQIDAETYTVLEAALRFAASGFMRGTFPSGGSMMSELRFWPST